jgi:hypothetical protein
MDEPDEDMIIQFHDSAKGAFELHLVDLEDITQADARFRGPTERFLRRLSDKKPGDRPRCLNCELELATDVEPAALAFLLPFAGSGRNTVLMGICNACTGGSPDLTDTTMKFLRVIWPDMHFLSSPETEQ